MTSRFVDFKEVKEKVSMEMVLARSGMSELKRSGENFRGKCPFHEGDGKRTLSVSLEKNLWYCFSCRAGGNVLDWVAKMDGSTIREAALKLQDLFLKGETEAKPKQEAKQEERKQKTGEPGVINPHLGFKLRLDAGHQYGQSRGFSKEILEQHGAGYCLSKGMFAGRFCFELANERGELIGYAGRRVDDNCDDAEVPKYLFPSSEKGFQKRYVLWNFDREVSELGVDAEVVVVEGFWDCLRVKEIGYPCVALLGSSLSENQTDLLATYFRRAILLLDGDKSGRQGTDDSLKRLGRRMFVKALELPEGKQPDMLSREEMVLLLMKGKAST